MVENFENILPIWEIKNPVFFSLYSVEEQNRFTLVKSVSIERVLINLDSSYHSRFTEDGLKNVRLQQEKLDLIFKRWSNKLPVDPPVLLWNHHNWVLEDGIHRINCALALGALSMPIILLSHEFPYIIPIL